MHSTAPTTTPGDSAAPQLRVYALDDHFHAQRATTPGPGFVEVRQWPADIERIGAVIARTMIDASAMARRQGMPAPGLLGG